MTDTPKKPLIDRRLAIFLAATFFIEASRSMTMVQVPVYLRELGADIRQIGLFFTLSLIFPLLLRIFGGWISDTIGRLRAMLLGSLAGVATYIAYALSPSWETALLAPAMLAVATALTIPSYYAHIAEQTTEGTRGRVFGFAETTRMLAWIFSPPLGGLLGQRFGYRTMFAAAAIAAGLAALIILHLNRQKGLPSETTESRPSLSSLWSSLRQMAVLSISGGLITWILITDGARDTAVKLSFDLMPVYLTDIARLTKGDIGLLDGIFGIAWVLTSFPAGWFVDKTSERAAITIGIVVQLLSMGVFALAGGFWGFAFSWILLGIGGAMLENAYSALIARGVPGKVRGITYGLVATSLGLFTLPFPWIGGQIWARFGPKVPFYLTVVLGSLALIPAWTKLVLREGEGEEELTGVTENPK
jgi:DHA1 family tetracycline resistance protein-like MFS transporter